MTSLTSTDLLQHARRQSARLHRAMHELAFGELLTTAAQLTNARWQLRDCDEVGPYTRVRGRIHVENRGELRIGEWTLLESMVTPISMLVHRGAALAIGPRTYLNFGVCIESRREILIGRGCHIGQYVHVMDNDQHDVKDHRACPSSRPVVLEDGVWLGARTIVLKGVTIGHGTSVGAGSVVTRSLPPRCVAAGAPAKVIRYLDEA